MSVFIESTILDRAEPNLFAQFQQNTPVLIQEDLYFGRNIGTTGRVTEAEFQQFLNQTITPLFPDGLTVYDANGQFLDSTNTQIREPSKVVSLLYEDSLTNQQSINHIIDAYKNQFQQESVLRVANQDITVSFDPADDSIENDPVPEFIQVDLYFGRNIGTTGKVSERQFQQFLNQKITSQFPDGLTVYEADGQFLDSSNTLIQEPSKVVSLIIEDTETNEQAIDTIINQYKDQFQQESVLEVVNEEVKVGFGGSEDLIDNDPVPEFIQVDLYFGRNIGTTGKVTNREFREFLNDVVTPKFPDGLTVYNAKGQFLDQFERLIREPSKVVSLITEDTQANEEAISQIIAAYKHQFQQESVLQVVDEEIGVAFGSVPVPIKMQRSYSASDHGSSNRMLDGSNSSFKGNSSLDCFAHPELGSHLLPLL
jgi:predicted nuclease of predicted toxin-antitoxin system